MRRLGGLMSVLPWTATLAMIAAAAMAGLPLFNGFLSKEMFFDEALTAQMAGQRLGRWLVPVAGHAGGASARWPIRCASCTTCSSTARRATCPIRIRTTRPGHAAPVLLLVLCQRGRGHVPGHLRAAGARPRHGACWARRRRTVPPGDLARLQPAAADERDRGAGGVVCISALQRTEAAPAPPAGWTGRLFFTRRSMACSARRPLHRLLENGSLQRYVAWMLALALLLAAWPFIRPAALPGTGSAPAAGAAAGDAVGVLLVGCHPGAGHHDRFQAVVLTGVVGWSRR
jgi:multicomponent K+:H+ antiporter subunit A